MFKRKAVLILPIFACLILSIAFALCFKINSSVLAFSSVSSQNISQEYDFEQVPIEQIEIIHDGELQLQPEQSVNLGIIATPSYAVQTTTHIKYNIINGTAFAEINNSTLTVLPFAPIGGVITVSAEADGKQSFNILAFTVVKIPVESVEILNSETQIKEGEALQLITKVLPENASYKNLKFEIVDGFSYATINQNGKIQVNSTLPAGNLTITVKVSSVNDTSKFSLKTFSLYVPTKSLSIAAENSYPYLGSTISLLPSFSLSATTKVPEYIIESGHEFVESINENELTIKSNISAFNPQIVLKAKCDGLISSSITIKIYILAQSLNFEAPKTIIMQGEMLELSAFAYPNNASLDNLQYHVIGDAAKLNGNVLTAKVLPLLEQDEVQIYASIDGITSNVITIIINKPDVVLTASEYNLVSSSKQADNASLNVLFNGVQENPVIVYNILSGHEFVESLNQETGVVQVKKNITANYPQIKLNAQVDEYLTGEILIEVKVLAEEILVANSNITQVEQQRSYTFSGSIMPLNATLVNERLTYSLNVNSFVATIDENGVLSITKNAQIGTEIIITINGPDGVVATHTVTVVTVYATEIKLNEVLKESGEEVTDLTLIYANDILSFNVFFKEPFNVTEAQKTFIISLHSGDIEAAQIVNNKLQIKSASELALININNPTFTVKITSIQSDETLTIYKTFSVYITVDNVELTKNNNVTVYEGDELLLSGLFETRIYPLCSNVQSAVYSITSGNDYAEIIDNRIVKISRGLTDGNLSFTVRATAEGRYDEVSFGIYVKTDNLSVAALTNGVVYNENSYLTYPISAKNYGESVDLSVTIDSKATTQNSTIKVTHGANWIVGNYNDGDIISTDLFLQFTLCKNLKALANFDKLITFEITHKDIAVSKTLNIVIYIPNEDINIVAENNNLVNRGETNSNILYLTGRTGKENNAEIEVISILAKLNETNAVSLPNCELLLTSPMRLRLDKEYNNILTAGTTVLITYKIKDDRLGYIFTSEFKVDKLDESKFSNPFEKDSNNELISKTEPQLFVGRYTDILIKYNGESLADFGVFIQDFGTLISAPAKTAEFNKLNKDTARLTVLNTASGKSSIYASVIILDGTETYEIKLPLIKVFKPIDFSKLDIRINNTDTTTLNVGDQLVVTGWDSTWTLNLEDLVWDNIIYENNLATNKGTLDSNFKVTNTAPATSIFKVGFNVNNKQKYNNGYYQYSSSELDYKEFNFTGIEYRSEKNASGVATVLKRVWKKWIEGTTTTITLDGQKQEKSGFVQTGWNSETWNNNSDSQYKIYANANLTTYSEIYSGNSSLVLYPHMTKLSVTIKLNDGGSVKVSKVDKDHHTGAVLVGLDTTALARVKYNNLALSMTIDVKADNKGDGREIWLDVDNAFAGFRQKNIDIQRQSWIQLNYSATLGISSVKNNSTVRFGFKQTKDYGWLFSGQTWYFGTASITFTAVR